MSLYRLPLKKRFPWKKLLWLLPGEVHTVTFFFLTIKKRCRLRLMISLVNELDTLISDIILLKMKSLRVLLALSRPMFRLKKCWLIFLPNPWIALRWDRCQNVLVLDIFFYRDVLSLMLRFVFEWVLLLNVIPILFSPRAIRRKCWYSCFHNRASHGLPCFCSRLPPLLPCFYSLTFSS